MMWTWLVAGLAVVWVVLWLRSRRSAHQLRLADPRRLQALRLEDVAATETKSGRYVVAQRARLKAAWLRTDPTQGLDEPPGSFEPGDDKHLMLADVIRRRYAETMTESGGEFAECTVKPSALLPFPKHSIADALNIFVRLGRGDIWSPHVAKESITPEDVTVVERALQVLNTYVDVAPNQVPTDPTENMEFAKQYLSKEQP